jgi:hypothetical protein
MMWTALYYFMHRPWFHPIMGGIGVCSGKARSSVLLNILVA